MIRWYKLTFFSFSDLLDWFSDKLLSYQSFKTLWSKKTKRSNISNILTLTKFLLEVNKTKFVFRTFPKVAKPLLLEQVWKLIKYLISRDMLLLTFWQVNFSFKYLCLVETIDSSIDYLGKYFKKSKSYKI